MPFVVQRGLNRRVSNVECLSSCVEIWQSVLLYCIKINNTVRYISRNTLNEHCIPPLKAMLVLIDL